MAEEKKLGRVKLKNVRLSFPHLFKPQAGQPDDNGNPGKARYNASFINEANNQFAAENERAVLKAIEDVKKAKWGDKIPKIKAEKLCWRDGDEESYDGYEGNWYLSSASPGDKKAPLLRDRRRNQVKEEDGLLYGGCYVNAIVTIWAQDDANYGKRINAVLEGVQFVAHGEAFGNAGISDDDFDEYDDDDDDDMFD